MNQTLRRVFGPLTALACGLALMFLAACASDSEGYDPYHDWLRRNEAWFSQIADSARTAIRAARQTYGDAWEQHCDWRMYKALTKSPDYNSGLTADSICVHILSRGQGSVSPLATDSVRCNYRGWLMPTIDANGAVETYVFDQTYYGAYAEETASPHKFGVSGVVSGFSTALQYMVVGDDWHVYIPYQLGYEQSAKTDVPAYSTLHFRVQLMGIYPQGQEVPEWK